MTAPRPNAPSPRPRPRQRTVARVPKRRLAALATALAAATPLAHAQDTFTGELTSDDPQLPSGEYYDVFQFELEEGDVIVADLTSDDFDCYLAVVAPDDTDNQNDDYGTTSRSFLEVPAHETGTWVVVVTSFSSNTTGRYDLTVTVNDRLIRPDGVPNLGGDPLVADDPPAPPADNDEIVLIDQRGTLSDDSPRTLRGEYYEPYNVDVVEGQVVTINQRANDFDSYLTVIDPSGTLYNDDDGGDGLNSRLVITIEETGRLQIFSAALSSGSFGQYHLNVTADRPGASILNQQNIQSTMPGERVLDEQGTLAPGDPTRDDGQHADTYTVQLNAGDALYARLTSLAVDTFLVITSPSGETWTNDDFRERVDVSLLEITADQAGEYTVQASSYAAGEVGDYRVTCHVQPARSADTAATPDTPTTDPPEPVGDALPEPANDPFRDEAQPLNGVAPQGAAAEAGFGFP